jgi:hypothetical protein
MTSLLVASASRPAAGPGNGIVLAFIAGIVLTLVLRWIAVVIGGIVLLMTGAIHYTTGTGFPNALKWAIILGLPALIGILIGGRVALRHLSEFEFRTRFRNIGTISRLWRIP